MRREPGPRTRRELRQINPTRHELLGIRVEERRIAVTDSRREIRVLYLSDTHREYPRDGETEFINPHVYRARVSLARVA